MTVLRLVGVTWWLQLKMRGRSAFDGLLSLVWPLFFATTIFLMYGPTAGAPALASAAVGASVMGIRSATSTTASFALQLERRQGTLELLVAAPAPFPLLILPLTLAMATIGAYSMVATLLWGRFVFGIAVPVAHPVTFVVAIAVTVLGIGVLGFLISVSTVRYRAAWALGSALELPVWLICGFLVPLDQLPGWLLPVAWLLAPTWGMAGIRAAVEGTDATGDLLAGAGLAAAYVIIGSLVAGRLVRSARAHATLALS